MFEYRLETFEGAADGAERELLRWLNERGEAGWEAFFVEPVPNGYRCWFKREQAAVRQGLERAQ